MSTPVLDASAFLAYLGDEPGAAEVAEAIAGGAAISTVNLAEVFSSTAERGLDPQQLATELATAACWMARSESSRSRPPTRSMSGVCAPSHPGAAAYTADSTWSAAKLDAELRQIRE